MRDEALAEIELEIDPWPRRRGRIQRAEIYNRRRRIAAIATTKTVTQQLTSAVEACRADRFAPVGHSSWGLFWTSRVRMKDAVGLPLTLPARRGRSEHGSDDGKQGIQVVCRLQSQDRGSLIGVESG